MLLLQCYSSWLIINAYGLVEYLFKLTSSIGMVNLPYRNTTVVLWFRLCSYTCRWLMLGGDYYTCISLVRCTHLWNIFQLSKRNFKFHISTQPCSILYLFYNLFRDIMSIYNEPPPGMCIVPDKDDITKVCVSQCTTIVFSLPATCTTCSIIFIFS